MRRLSVIAVLLLTLVVAVAQRKVTPVASTDELKPVTKEELKEIRRQEKLKFLRTDSLTLDSLRRDSIERASKRVYRPTLMGSHAWCQLLGASDACARSGLWRWRRVGGSEYQKPLYPGGGSGFRTSRLLS